MQKIDYKRNCPACGVEIFYTSLQSYNKATKNVTTCKKCKFVRNKISNDKIEKVLLLNDNNVSNAEIARIVGISYNSVSKLLKDNDRGSIFINKTIDMVSDNEAKCSKCNDVKDISNFSSLHKGLKYECKTSICNECRKIRHYDLLNSDLEKYLFYRYRSLKRSAKERNITFSISKQYFIEQYNRQEGKCFYTDINLICKIGQKHEQRDVLSIDRIDTNKGYIIGNIVFTTVRINRIKNDLTLEELHNWIPTWFERIIQFIKEH